MNMKEDIRGYAAHLKYDFAPTPELHRSSKLALRKGIFLQLYKLHVNLKLILWYNKINNTCVRR